MSEYTGPLKKPGPPGQHKAMYDALEGKSAPFCECEYHGCAQHTGPDIILPADLRAISTLWGTFKICIACREAHPIPSHLLKESK